jgi:hypothetical protein
VHHSLPQVHASQVHVDKGHEDETFCSEDRCKASDAAERQPHAAMCDSTGASGAESARNASKQRTEGAAMSNPLAQSCLAKIDVLLGEFEDLHTKLSSHYLPLEAAKQEDP